MEFIRNILIRTKDSTIVGGIRTQLRIVAKARNTPKLPTVYNTHCRDCRNNNKCASASILNAVYSLNIYPVVFFRKKKIPTLLYSTMVVNYVGDYVAFFFQIVHSRPTSDLLRELWDRGGGEEKKQISPRESWIHWLVYD